MLVTQTPSLAKDDGFRLWINPSYGRAILRSVLLLIATITGVAAQDRGPLSDEERAAIERRQNERVTGRMREAQRLDRPRVLTCMSRPETLVGLDRDELRARCGPWQTMRPAGSADDIDELIYREDTGTLLLRVIADRKVISAATR